MQELDRPGLREHICRTLWSPGGEVLLEVIDKTHIFNGVWERWAKEGQAGTYTTALPGPASAARNVADKSAKPMTEQINLVPFILCGGIAMSLGDTRSMQTYNQWREKIDSQQDYVATMIRRGRYVGRLQQGMGV